MVSSVPAIAVLGARWASGQCAARFSAFGSRLAQRSTGVMPAKAGIQGPHTLAAPVALDSRLRGNDTVWVARLSANFRAAP